VGFVGPLAGVGGGVFLAVGLLGVDVNLARAGGLLVATSSVAGSLQAGGCGYWAHAGAAVSLGAYLGALRGLWRWGVGVLW